MKKRKDMAVLSQNAATESFFQAKLSSSNFKAVALTRAPENEGENQDICLETIFTLRLAVILTCSFSGVFCDLWFVLIVQLIVVFVVSLSILWHIFS